MAGLSLSEEYAAASRGDHAPKRRPVVASIPLKGIKASRLLLKLMQTLNEEEMGFVMQESPEMVRVILEGCLEELKRGGLESP